MRSLIVTSLAFSTHVRTQWLCKSPKNCTPKQKKIWKVKEARKDRRIRLKTLRDDSYWKFTKENTEWHEGWGRSHLRSAVDWISYRWESKSTTGQVIYVFPIKRDWVTRWNSSICTKIIIIGINKNLYWFFNVQNVPRNENPIYVFLFWELHGLSPNFPIHVSVSGLYIPRIGPHIFLHQNRQTDPGTI